MKKEVQLKMSRFNVLFQKEGRHYIYNTLKESLHQLDSKLFFLCEAIHKGMDSINSLDNKLLEKFFQAGYIVDPSKEIDVINQMRYVKLLRSFQSDRLSLVIAPTLYCNFACPYCYEKNLPKKIMSQEVVADLIHFIKKEASRFKFLEICWHGGEPLVAVNVVSLILTKIKELNLPIGIKIHSMITNGYLLTPDRTEIFHEFPLDYIQITIDGNRDTHNMNRLSKNHSPTFDRIINNIDTFVQEFPKTRVGIRMNIHKDNYTEFIPLYNDLSKRWEGHNIQIYPAFVMDNQHCRVPCLHSTQKTEFLYKVYKAIGRKYPAIDMKFKLGDCTAMYENSYVIDPEGEFYKCWADIGIKERQVGNLKGGIHNLSLIEKYLLNSDKFTDPKCLICNIFPVCNGGCNRYRLNPEEEIQREGLCPLSQDLIAAIILPEES